MPKRPPIDLLAAPLRILILSPQPWVGLQVSKHHYAREFATLGHEVIFANPPGGADGLKFSPSGQENITLLDHPTMALRRSKFRARWLFDRLAARRAAAIVAAAGPIDLLWDFDNAGQFADHRVFAAKRSILHVMDQLETATRHARHADVIFGVAPPLIDDLPPATTPRHMVPHGLAPQFAEIGRMRLASTAAPSLGAAPITVGFLGNLAQPWMDRPRTLGLIADNPALHFRFIGPVQDAGSDTAGWLNQLAALPNVELTGIKAGAELEAAMLGVHIWLLCYDGELDPNRGSNSHKLLEYFVTGAEVVSSHITAQADAPGIFMAPADSPDRIDALLRGAVAAVQEGRDTGWRQRIERALANGYAANVQQMAGHIAALAASGR